MIFIFDMFHIITETWYSIITFWLKTESLITVYNWASVSINFYTNGQTTKSQLCKPLSEDKWETKSCIWDHRVIGNMGGEQRIISPQFIGFQTLLSQLKLVSVWQYCWDPTLGPLYVGRRSQLRVQHRGPLLKGAMSFFRWTTITLSGLSGWKLSRLWLLEELVRTGNWHRLAFLLLQLSFLSSSDDNDNG